MAAGGLERGLLVALDRGPSYFAGDCRLEGVASAPWRCNTQKRARPRLGGQGRSLSRWNLWQGDTERSTDRLPASASPINPCHRFIDSFRSVSSGAPCAVQPMRPDTDGERSECGYPGTFVSSRKCCPKARALRRDRSRCAPARTRRCRLGRLQAPYRRLRRSWTETQGPTHTDPGGSRRVDARGPLSPHHPSHHRS